MRRPTCDNYITVQSAPNGFLVVVMARTNDAEEEYAISPLFKPLHRHSKELAMIVAQEKALKMGLEVR